MKRLLDEGSDDFARELLRSAEDDAPSAAAREKAIAAATVAVAAGPARPPWLKGAAIVGVSGVAVFVALRALSGSAPREPTKPVGTIATVAATTTETVMPVPSATPAPTTTVTAEPPPAANPPPSASTSPVAAKPSASTRRTTDGDTDLLERELAALDRARTALASNDAGGALRELGSYKRTFPKGALRQEALALEIDATFAKGDDAGARKLATTFLSAFPDSPQAPRIRRRLERP